MNSIRRWRRGDETYILNLTGPFPEAFILSNFSQIQFSISDIFRRCGNIIFTLFQNRPYIYDCSHISPLPIFFVFIRTIWNLGPSYTGFLYGPWDGLGVTWILNQHDQRIILSLALLHVRAPQQRSCVSSWSCTHPEEHYCKHVKKTLGYCVLFFYIYRKTHTRIIGVK